jgi:hypothetical protein
VSEEPAPERIAIIWSPEARGDLLAIERTPRCRFCTASTAPGTRASDAKRLEPPLTGFRCAVATVVFSST